MGSTPKPRFQVSLLGPFEMIGPGGPVALTSKKLIGLLAFLACTAPERHSRAKLITLLWGSHFEAQARQNLRQALSRLRRIIGPDALTSGDETVALAAGAIGCDVARFTTLLREETHDALVEAVDLYRDCFLADLAVDEEALSDWLTTSRQKLEGLALDAMANLAEQELRLGRPDRALAAARRAVAVNNLREDAHRLIIRALVASGRRADALKQYAHLVDVLKRELDIGPDPASAALLSEVRASSSALVARADSMPAAVSATARDHASVAVLPFTNLSRDPRQEYFSDGISEDIITALAKFSGLVVIARNTTFRYKGMAVDVVQIGRRLNVRYVLEGSVRRDKQCVRVTAQLIDTHTGAHIWADRFDRKVEDVFKVQDDITDRIVGMLVRHVSRAELERVRRTPPANFEAYDHYLQAGHLLRAAFAVRERGGPLLESRIQLELAVSKDPNFALAYTQLAHNCFQAWAEPPHCALLENEFRNSTTLDKALFFARKAIEVDPHLAESHAALGLTLFWQRRHGEAFAAYDRAFAINPNLQDDLYGNALVLGGRAKEAIAYLTRLVRTDPTHGQHYGWLGLAHYLQRDYAKAAELLQTCKQFAAGWRPGPFFRAAALAQLGRLHEAKAEASENMRLSPNFTIKRWRGQFADRYANRADFDHIVDGVRKAGLPE